MTDQADRAVYGVLHVEPARAVVWLRCPYELNERAKTLPGRRWDPDAKVWVWDVPVGRLWRHVRDLRRLFPDIILSDDDPWAGLPHHARPLEETVAELLQNGAFGVRLAELGSRRPLFAHQRRVPAAALICRRFLVLDEMGTGKTQAAIEAGCVLLREGAVRRVVVVCPLAVRENWRREIEACAWVAPDDVAVVENNPPASTGRRARGLSDRDYRLAQLLRRATWTVMHYEALRLHPREVADLVEDQMLVLDEVHRLKNPRAQISRVAARLRPAWLLGLSGTLIVNRPEDAWLPLKLVSPRLAGSEASFRVRYLVERELQTADGRRFRKVVGYKRLDELRRRVMTVALRKRKDECLDLPPRQHVARLCALSERQKRAYLDMLDQARLLLDHDEQWFEVNAASVAAQIVRLQQIAAGFASPSPERFAWFEDNGKLAELEALLEEAAPLVVWTRFVPVVRWLSAHFGDRAVAVWGGVRPDQRQAAVDRFQSGGADLFVGQVRVAGEGINLHRAATVVFWDHWWSPGVLRQAVDRCHRIGQDRPVTVVHLLSRGTIDEYVYAQLADKARWADAVQDGMAVDDLEPLRWTKQAYRRALSFRPE